MICNLIKEIIKVSEKAANIARICRSDEHLFSLLIEEKSEDEANSRFINDFKTLADVLIQETVRYDIGKKFPNLRDNIRGEENASFSNKIGETIIVEIFSTIEMTASRLGKVLGSDPKAANLLAKEVHRNITNVDDLLNKIPEIQEEFDENNIGIIIDPIDATNEYIKAERRESQVSGIAASGLECVTVLIGVYEISSGKPIIGVINQPFDTKSNDSYKSKIFWGISMENIQFNNLNINPNCNHEKRVILSSSEDKKYIKLFEEMKYNVIFSAGAGHKLLRLVTGDVDLFFLSKGTCFKWDTCAPHAILSSLGYKLIDINKSIKLNQPIDINYNLNEGKCNSGGVFGYKNIKDFDLLTNILFKH